MAGRSSSFRTLYKAWYEPAAIPIFVVVGVAVTGCGWYLTHLARHPDVAWNRHGNPHPWDDVTPKMNTKLYVTSQNKDYFDSTWKRNKL